MNKKLVAIGIGACMIIGVAVLALTLALERPIETISADNYSAVPSSWPGGTHGVRIDPSHPFRIGEQFYPDESKRHNEQGRCVVEITISAAGRVTRAHIVASSGFPALDNACLNGVHDQYMIPAMNDGVPYETTVKIPIVWKLTDQPQRPSSN